MAFCISRLDDRSAYSMITINFEPEFPVLTPTPTATPIPWNPGQTFDDATETVTLAYQGIAVFLIWLVVAILPLVLPPALLLWGLWKLMNRKTVKVVDQKAQGD